MESQLVHLSKKPQIRAFFLIASILTCGLALFPWLGYEIYEALRK